MTLVVLLILAVIWSLYIASWVRNRAQVRSVNSISSFNQHLSVLERSRPAGVATPLRAVPSRPTNVRAHDPLVRPPQVRGLLSGPPITLGDARRRRRQVLTLLSGVAALSLVPWALLGPDFWYVAAVGFSVLAFYVLLLVRAQKLAEERHAKVRYLPTYDDLYEADDYYEPAFAR